MGVTKDHKLSSEQHLTESETRPIKDATKMQNWQNFKGPQILWNYETQTKEDVKESSLSAKKI